MTERILRKRLLCFLLTPALIFSGAAIIVGCGGEEETPPVENPTAAPVEAPTEKPAEPIVPAKPAGPPMAEVVPSTLPALAFMPAEAQIAFALPALPGLRDSILPLVKALSEPDRDIDAELRETVSSAAGEIGVQADTYEALAAALGVDPAAPVAVFGDFSKTVASAQAAKAKYDAEHKAEEAAAPAAPTDPASAEPQGSEPSPEESADEPSSEPDHFKDADAPAWVVVLGVTDPAKARTEMERIIAADSTLSALPGGTEEVEGITVTTRDIWGYFTTDKQMIFGNLELLRGAVKRVKDPASFRYGTIECPPSVADEAVALVYGSRLMPLLETGLPLMGVKEEALPQLQTQIASYKAMFSSESDDPMVITGSMASGKIEFNTRIDSATHAGLLEETGQPTPLRLARYLPDNTLALISLRLSEEMKKQFIDQVMPAVSATGDSDAAAQAGMATQVINQIGDEITIGVAGAQGGFPTAYVMIGLSQPEATKGLLQMFLPMPESVPYEGFSIGKIALFPGLDVNLSFVDNILLASTSEDGVKAVIDLHKAQKASALFSSMEPPLDIEKPVYQTIVLNSALIEQGMGLASMLPVSGAAEANPGLIRVTNAIREVRAVGQLEGTWLSSNLTVYLKDLDAALAASKAAATATASAPEGTEAPAGSAPESK